MMGAAATGTEGAAKAARVERALRVRRGEKKAATAANMVTVFGQKDEIEIVRGEPC